LHVMFVRSLLTSQVPHNEQSPFMCAVCKKSFKQADALKMHLHTHTGGWPFTCGFCRKSFNQFGAKYVHLYTYTLYWQFICVIYKNTMMMSSALKVWSIKFMRWYDQIFLLYVKCNLFAW